MPENNTVEGKEPFRTLLEQSEDSGALGRESTALLAPPAVANGVQAFAKREPDTERLTTWTGLPSSLSPHLALTAIRGRSRATTETIMASNLVINNGSNVPRSDDGKLRRPAMLSPTLQQPPQEVMGNLSSAPPLAIPHGGISPMRTLRLSSGKHEILPSGGSNRTSNQQNKDWAALPAQPWLFSPGVANVAAAKNRSFCTHDTTVAVGGRHHLGQQRSGRAGVVPSASPFSCAPTASDRTISEQPPGGVVTDPTCEMQRTPSPRNAAVRNGGTWRAEVSFMPPSLVECLPDDLLSWRRTGVCIGDFVQLVKSRSAATRDIRWWIPRKPWVCRSIVAVLAYLKHTELERASTERLASSAPNPKRQKISSAGAGAGSAVEAMVAAAQEASKLYVHEQGDIAVGKAPLGEQTGGLLVNPELNSKVPAEVLGAADTHPKEVAGNAELRWKILLALRRMAEMQRHLADLAQMAFGPGA